jgi:hypothetical protein
VVAVDDAVLGWWHGEKWALAMFGLGLAAMLIFFVASNRKIFVIVTHVFPLRYLLINGLSVPEICVCFSVGRESDRLLLSPYYSS